MKNKCLALFFALLVVFFFAQTVQTKRSTSMFKKLRKSKDRDCKKKFHKCDEDSDCCNNMRCVKPPNKCMPSSFKKKIK